MTTTTSLTAAQFDSIFDLPPGTKAHGLTLGHQRKSVTGQNWLATNAGWLVRSFRPDTVTLRHYV